MVKKKNDKQRISKEKYMTHKQYKNMVDICQTLTLENIFS